MFQWEKRGIFLVYPNSMFDDTDISIFNKSHNNVDDYHGYTIVNDNGQDEPSFQLQKYL